MKTDVIKIYSDLQGSSDAMEAADKFAVYNDITGKNAMHLRLLTEELVSMIHGILDEFCGLFWLESERTKKGLLCRICFSADKQINRKQEEHILSVSTSGKNENVKGVMGRIRELFRRGIQAESVEDERYLTSVTDAMMSMGMMRSGASASSAAFWSLQAYRQDVYTAKDNKTEEWDELEKSIIAKLADEVKVWLKTDVTEIVIEKLFPVK